ncbi:LysR family transcriptional regulator [Paenibacillus turpanensis]|uniref:LysR family transcriptional regulator n=1 Tax=Paenibacillus turpanensis TaxID=2689078 RepID=UPI001408AADC|nr:LysR family transcriptional regulator [Paenibacillus turpanensis]
MDLSLFQTLLESAKRGSYTKAAESLGYAQSSVTAHIQKLEEEYGTTLFERSGRGITLTPAGEELCRYARQLLELYKESKTAVSKDYPVELAVGTIETLAAFFLPPYLRKFRSEEPKAWVVLHPHNESDIIKKVRDGELDVGIILDTLFTDAELSVVPIREEPLVLIAQHHHPFAEKTSVQIDELQGERIIFTEEGCTYRAMFTHLLRRHNVRFDVACELGSLEAIKACVKEGLGIALVPEIAAKAEVDAGTLKAVPLVHPDLRFYTQMVYREKERMSEPMKAWIKLFAVNSSDE